MRAYGVPLLDSPALVRYGLPEYRQHDNPVAGTDFTASVPGPHLTRLITVSVRIVTDANAANREVVLYYESAEGNRFALAGINATVAANTTADYYFSAFQPGVTATVDSSSLVPLHPLLLLPTQVWRLRIVNVQAGDQLSRIRSTWERFYSTDQPPVEVPVPGPEYL